MTARGHVGAEAVRTDDRALLTGSARFVADVDREGQLWARVVRSPVAHATIERLDVTTAGGCPGVVAVLTADDVPDARIPIRLPFAATPETDPALQTPLAHDRVRYVGEPVALVVATDPFSAEDAAEVVELELRDREPVLDLEWAADADALHDGLPGNLVNRVPMTYGDVDRLFSEAAVIVRERLSVHRHTGAPLETRGLLAEWDAGSERLTVWGAAKVKHFNRQVLSQMLDLPAAQIRLVELHVGGAFGVRGEFYPEDLLIPLAAMRLGRPVKWVEDRREHFIATNHARQQVHDFEVAASADGRLLAFRDRAWCDQGAYVRTQGILPALLPALQIAGPYAWSGFAIDSSAVLTNRTPVGTYRAPGVTEATFVRERMLDRIAAELRLDPAELRRRNLIPADRMPWVFDLGPEGDPIVYESGDFPAFFGALLSGADYDALRAEQRERSARGEAVGLGLSAFCEVGGVGPFEHARIACEDGGFGVYVGVGSVGQGVGTALAQIAADCLGVGLDRVTIHHHDTGDTPEGFGTFASRSTVMAGNAIAVAARNLREKAAVALGMEEDGLDLEAHLPAVAEHEIGGDGIFEKEHPSFSFGANVALVSVDRDLGRVRVERHLVACDVGRAVNPALLRGQLCGGAVQGIAGALFEELPYREDGEPEARSFEDYLLPTAGDVPAVETVILEHPTPTNPLGIKGSGEAGVAGAPAAVANAVADALGVQEHLTALPLTPSAVRRIIRDRA